MIYILIKKQDISIAILNRSTSRYISELPCYKFNSNYDGFLQNDEICILKFEEKHTNITTIFDNFTWMDANQVNNKIKELYDNNII